MYQENTVVALLFLGYLTIQFYTPRSKEDL